MPSRTAPRPPDAPSDGGAAAGFPNVVGRSPALREAVRLARRMAAGRTTVLISGATGTGKELFARGIHYAGPTAGEPFVAVNCAAIPGSLLESELFGHERGAFTDAREAKRGLFELAGTGTLFLDEIHELPPPLQPKLLRVLEERTLRRLGGAEEVRVGCRVMAATNLALEDAVARGEFREDLFYRLNVFRLLLPRLAERGDDVLLLAAHYLERLAREHGGAPRTLSGDALAVLKTHAWPGNVRELKNVIERAAVLSDGGVIRAEHLMIQRRTSSPAGSGGGTEIRIPPGGTTLDEVERQAVLATLAITGGNQSAAARILAISRPTLLRKMRRWGLAEPGRVA